MKATESKTTEARADTAPRTAKSDEPDTTTKTAATGDDSDAKSEKAKAAARECVVDDGTPHTGRATPGAAICSAHAMHYRADGTPRAEDVKAEDVKRDE